MKSCAIHLLSILFLVLLLLAGSTVSMGQTQLSSAATPCQTPVPNPARGADKSSQRQQLGKPSDDDRQIQIEFLGLNAIPYCDALSALRNADKPVTTDKMPNLKAMVGATTALKEQLESMGYMRARVDGVRDDEARRVLFVVNEGQRLSLSDVRFEGNRFITSEELSQNYKGCLNRFSGDGFNGEVHSYCERFLAGFIRSRGYLQALIKSEHQISDRGIVVNVNVDEGQLYRLGKIDLHGNKALTNEQVRAKLKLREGEIANGEKVAEWLFEDLKNLYDALGFIQYTAEILPTFKSESGLVDFEVEINEGLRFTLQSIEFSGYDAKRSNPHDLFVLWEGDLYNESLFRESIKRLNDSGWFDFVDADKDVTYLTNPEEHTVRLIVNLRSKN